MKLKSEFILHKDGKESFLIPAGNAEFSGVVRGNEIFGNVAELLQNDTTEAEIVSNMRSKYNAPEGVIEHDVKKAIDNLREIGAIID